jgi:hypothetical protein
MQELHDRQVSESLLMRDGSIPSEYGRGGADDSVPKDLARCEAEARHSTLAIATTQLYMPCVRASISRKSVKLRWTS